MTTPPHFSPQTNALLFVLFLFQVWMLIDSIRRRAPLYWPLLIFIFTPAAVIYFFLVKLPELSGRKPAVGVGSGARSQTLEELAEQARQTPSELNKLAYADRLSGDQRFSEAVGRYRDVLRQNPQSKEALHGVARAQLNLSRPLEAIEELATLMELDPEFRDYGAALDYAEALWQAGKQEDAIGLLTGLVSVSKRINHRMALASYLKERGDSATARSELDQALREYATQPDSVQRRDQLWAERARKLLAELN